jgi:predicted phosphoribosyltransferase
MFKNRKEAGKKLAKELVKFKYEDIIILAIPRGGVVIAYEIVKTLGCQWDLIIPRKISSPHNKELAVGAVSSDGSYFIDKEYINSLKIPEKYIEYEITKEFNEIKRRLREYKGNDSFPEVKGKTTIIVDDGIATGYTILAAIKSVIKHGANKVILAVPVASKESVAYLKETVDEVICLYIPLEFHAVGLYYEDFGQISDEKVSALLQELKNY